MMEGEAQEEVVRDVGREGWRTDHARRQQRLNERKGRGSDEEKKVPTGFKGFEQKPTGHEKQPTALAQKWGHPVHTIITQMG